MVIDTSSSLVLYDPPDSWVPTRYGNFLPARRNHAFFLPHKESNWPNDLTRTARVDSGVVYTQESQTESLGAGRIGLMIDVYV